jgi:hypothetical protein
LRAVTKELNKIKLERKKGKNIQKRAKKRKKTELTALSKEFLKNRKEERKGYSKKGTITLRTKR